MGTQTHQMVVAEHIEVLNSLLQTAVSEGKQVGFAPTMGALHPGHTSLIERASKECDLVVSSIFVNPTQFNQTSDLTHYPRTLKEDLALLEACGCDIAFVPSVPEIYPAGPVKAHWDFGLLSSTLEGHFRPGHFDGVLTVVKRLFQIVAPHKAFFGEKDFQQLAHIRKMVEAEHMDIRIISCETIREPDGLAMSSRNLRLSHAERKTALCISRVLREMKDRTQEFDPPALEQWGRAEFQSTPGIRLEYLEVTDGRTFAPVPDWHDSEYPVILCAAYVGEVRLIDNLVIRQPMD